MHIHEQNNRNKFFFEKKEEGLDGQLSWPQTNTFKTMNDKDLKKLINFSNEQLN